ncbi:MAG: hypothetical protein A2017_14735 [Lentisphaerae bacterium GWF2_44_16]|nr:MAG: hypothetical protein A2017_14735 [Lentisphaerae bacterium GWF2_44_16]
MKPLISTFVLSFLFCVSIYAQQKQPSKPEDIKNTFMKEGTPCVLTEINDIKKLPGLEINSSIVLVKNGLFLWDKHTYNVQDTGAFTPVEKALIYFKKKETELQGEVDKLSKLLGVATAPANSSETTTKKNPPTGKWVNKLQTQLDNAKNDLNVVKTATEKIKSNYSVFQEERKKYLETTSTGRYPL